METFTAAPLNLVSGICDMQLAARGGNLVLYTATRAGGGVLALDVDGAMALIDQEGIAPGTTLPAPAGLELLQVNGAPHLVVSGANQGGVRTLALDGGGALAGDTCNIWASEPHRFMADPIHKMPGLNN
ncbi:hypothetical protein [Tabrizicola sp.]|uniref:hypothetical protein n=1 Tax=Tabrizicola sp. TaxID=2005166 RepID=UPI0035B09632